MTKTDKSEDAIWVEVDNPGGQFAGWVTRESRERSNCIEDWVRCDPPAKPDEKT